MKHTLFFLVLLGLGCGSAHDTPPRIAEADYMAARIAAEVDLANRCCQQVGSTGVRDDYKAGVEQGFVEHAGLPASGATYDEDAASACIEQLKHATCAPLKGMPATDLDAPCNNVYVRGDRKIGEACRSFYDCSNDKADATACEPIRDTDGGVAQVCVRYEEVGEGKACTSIPPTTDVQCQPGLFCDPKLNKCVKPAARGEVCITGPAYGDTCEAGWSCDRTSTKRCIEPPAVGDPCGSGLPECEGLACYGGKCREPLFVTSSTTVCKW